VTNRNFLTAVNSIRHITALNQKELQQKVPYSASWHRDYSASAYIFIGGLPRNYTEGDIICVFSQYVSELAITQSY